MTITRAIKPPPSPAKSDATALTPEQFIAAANTLPAEKPAPVPEIANGREKRALTVVDSHLPWVAAAGMLPMPGLDLATIIGMQMRMLSSLAKVYDVPFREQAAKSTVATLMATVLENTLAGGFASVLKFVPVVGSVLGILTLSATATAGTFAIGKVFITHFEAGGTFLDFDPKKVQRHFRAEFEKARA